MASLGDVVTKIMSNSSPGADDVDDHLDDLPDGCGCVEVWTALSEQRTGDREPSGPEPAACERGPSA